MVAVVPYEMPPTCGSRQPEPSTSQALSAAAAITGVPAGIPVAVLAAALTRPSVEPTGRSSGSCSRRIDSACHFQSDGFAHACALKSNGT